MSQSKGISGTIELPKGVTFTLKDRVVIIKGPKGENQRKLADKYVKITQEGDEIVFNYDKNTKREKKKMYTAMAHIKNMIKGANEGYTYTLKICSGHFPMAVSLKGDTFEIKNFIGEQVPRRLKLKTGATVKIAGDIITVESPNKELAGQTAASIENLTKRPGFDKRIFQDGIYITNKDGKQM